VLVEVVSGLAPCICIVHYLYQARGRLLNQRRVVFSKVCSVLCCLLCASVVCEGISFDFAAFCFRCPPLPSPPRPPRAPHSSPPVLAPPRRRARAGGSPGAWGQPPSQALLPATSNQRQQRSSGLTAQGKARLAGSAQHRTISGSISGQRPPSHPRVLNATPTAGWLG